MSMQEVDRLEVVRDVVEKRLRQRRAAELLGVCARTFRRLINHFTH